MCPLISRDVIRKAPHRSRLERRLPGACFNGAGFTLIELLVVIAIIALLVSMLVPTLKNAKELARKAACMARQHSLGPAFGVYWNENNFHNPLWREANADGSYNFWNTYWPWAMRPYVGLSVGDTDLTADEKNDITYHEKAFNCPSAYLEGTWSWPLVPPFVGSNPN